MNKIENRLGWKMNDAVSSIFEIFSADVKYLGLERAQDNAHRASIVLWHVAHDMEELRYLKELSRAIVSAMY